MAKKQDTFYLDVELIQALNELSAKTEIPKNRLVARAIRKLLKDEKKKK
jgi:predicted transcriptional regulator